MTTAELLREAARNDLPAQLRASLLAEAERLETAGDGWLVAVALAIKYAGSNGEALVGALTRKWIGERVSFRVDRDGDAIRIHWRAPPVNALPGTEA